MANAQKRTITKQTTSGVQTSSKSIAGSSYANAHRTTVQSGTLRSSTQIQQGYAGASKTINVGYVDTSTKSQMQANNQPSQRVNTAISSSISAPTQPQHTLRMRIVIYIRVVQVNHLDYKLKVQQVRCIHKA